MISVYVWRPKGLGAGVFGESVGHASMLVLPEPGRPANGRYISWWPVSVGPGEAVTNAGVRPYPNNWTEDLRDMGRGPDCCWQLNWVAPHFDEAGIIRAWDEQAWRGRFWMPGNLVGESYRALDRNCCSTVMNLLFGPGDGARYRGFGPIPATWWGPNDVNAWMGSAERRYLARSISPPPPPPGNVPAYGRCHLLEGPEAERLTELGRRRAVMAPPRRR